MTDGRLSVHLASELNDAGGLWWADNWRWTLLLDECRLPLVLAPLAGGPSTPELCAAVTEAGALGFLAAGYLAAAELAARIDQTRELTARPFGVNLFVPTMDGDAAAVEAYARRLEPAARRAGVRLGSLAPTTTIGRPSSTF